MDDATLIINRVLPILLLLGLGYWIRRSQFLAASTIDDLRSMAVNLALPSVLFISFLEIELEAKYLVIFVVLFGLCIALYGLGLWLKTRLKVQYIYFPFMMTGFEYGMLGVSLFGGAYGLDNIGYIAVVDLGHEIFIWFVFLALLLRQRDNVQTPAQLAGSFLRSPVIIGILAGLLFNALDARDFLFDSAVTGGIINTMNFLSALTVPLILIIVGYGIKIDRAAINDAAAIIIIRLVILIPLAILLNIVLIDGLLELEEGFQAALFTLMILPPPFIIPLYMRPDLDDERRYINNVLTLYTVVTIVIFAIYFVINPEV